MISKLSITWFQRWWKKLIQWKQCVGNITERRGLNWVWLLNWGGSGQCPLITFQHYVQSHKLGTLAMESSQHYSFLHHLWWRHSNSNPPGDRLPLVLKKSYFNWSLFWKDGFVHGEKWWQWVRYCIVFEMLYNKNEISRFWIISIIFLAVVWFCVHVERT